MVTAPTYEVEEEAEAPLDVESYTRFTKDDPCGWTEECLGQKLWSKQKEALNLIRDHNRVAWASANGVGKTFLSTIAGLWFSECHYPSYVIYTSSSWAGIYKSIFPEFKRVHSESKTDLGGELLNAEWQRGIQWGVFGLSPNKPEIFGGYRSKGGVLIIIDEASALSYELYNAILGIAAANNYKILMIGNPLRPEGPFFDAFNNTDWKTMQISAFDVPNVSGKEEFVQGLATPETIEEKKRQWGEASPAYQSRVLGLFPKSGKQEVVPRGWNEQMTGETIPKGTKRMGVDPARFGGDRIVCLYRDDTGVREIEVKQYMDTMEIAGWVIVLAEEWGIEYEDIYIDEIGVGAGVVDRLHEVGADVNGINVARAANEKERFANERAECMWNCREALNPAEASGFKIDEQYQDLIHELHMPRYTYTSLGQILVEDKEAIKKRLEGRSPDLSDALCLTFSGKKIDEFVD